MIIIGYLLIIAYIVTLILLSEKVFTVIIKQEYCRKILHIGSFITLPIANYFFGDASIHFVIICCIFTILTCILYFTNKFKNIDNRVKKYPGIIYYSLSLLICSIISCIWKETSNYFGIAFLGLAFGDGFATLIGSSIKNPKIYKNKTIIGFISCFVVTFISILFYDKITDSAFELYEILSLALFASIIELIDYGLDNLAIPLSLFFLSWAICNIDRFSVSLIIFECVFVIALFSKFIEYYGALLASTIGFMFYYYMGIIGIIYVLSCYLILIVISIISKIMKNDLSSMVKKTKGKDFVEVFVNGIWAILGLIIFAITKNETMLIITLLALSEGFVDSIASDIGTLSKKQPYDIFKRKFVVKGESGGMTVLGSISSLIGAFVFALAIVLIFKTNMIYLPIFTLMLYFGSFIDSLLGSLLQVKYKCITCKKITEREEHCGLPTEQICGYKIFNNDTVNMLSGLSVFLIALTLLI